MTKKRPSSITVFAILNMVFGGIFLLCMGCSLALAPLAQSFQAQQGQKIAMDQQKLQKLVQDHLDATVPGYAIFRKVALVITLVLPAFLIVAGLALLRMSAVARSLCIGWSLVAILYLLGSMIYQIAFVNEPSAEFMKKQQLELPSFVTDSSFYTLIGIVFSVLLIIYPIILLVFAMLPSTGKAFAAGRIDEYSGGSGDDYYGPEFERRRREPPAET
jgi:hypothetical protein